MLLILLSSIQYVPSSFPSLLCKHLSLWILIVSVLRLRFHHSYTISASAMERELSDRVSAREKKNHYTHTKKIHGHKHQHTTSRIKRNNKKNPAEREKTPYTSIQCTYNIQYSRLCSMFKNSKHTVCTSGHI